MTNGKLLSQTISFLRFPVTLGILYVHFYLAKGGLSIHGVRYGVDCPDWFFYTNVYFSGVLVGVCVPIFYWISGLLFFHNMEFSWKGYWEKLRRRGRTLLIPYILWNIIAILWTAKIFLPFLSSFFTNAGHIELNLTWQGFLYTFLDNSKGLFLTPETIPPKFMLPIDGPLWYIRVLMQLVILSPVIYWLVKKLKIWLVLALGVTTLFFCPPDFGGMPFWTIFYFCWGAYYSIHKRDVIAIMRKYWFMPLVYFVVTIIDLTTYGLPINYYTGNLVVVVGIPALIVGTSYLLEKGYVKVNTTLANSSFFVFALHTMIMYDMAKILVLAFHIPNNPYVLLVFYFAMPLITAFVCVAIYLALRRWMPSFCGLLTGGRT